MIQALPFSLFLVVDFLLLYELCYPGASSFFTDDSNSYYQTLSLMLTISVTEPSYESISNIAAASNFALNYFSLVGASYFTCSSGSHVLNSLSRHLTRYSFSYD